jgi:hypothetical protein
VKANRFLTQAKKLKDCAEPLQRHAGADAASRRSPGARSCFSFRRASGSIWSASAEFIDLLPKDLTHVFEFGRRVG